MEYKFRAVGLLLGLLMYSPSVDLQAQHQVHFQEGLANLYFNGSQIDAAGFLTFTNEKNFSFPTPEHIIGSIEFYQVEGTGTLRKGAFEFVEGGFLGDDRFTFDIDNDAVLVLRRDGGFGPLLELSNGAHCTQGGVWTNNCSANLKHLHREVQEGSILEKIKRLPIYDWSYKSVPTESHIGPTAQDFNDLFQTGTDREKLASVDLAGVSLAGVKSLYELVLEQAEEIRKLKEMLEDRFEK